MKICVAVDGSEMSGRVLAMARRVAQLDEEAELTVVNVFTGGVPSAGEVMNFSPEVLDRLERDAEAVIAKAEDELSDVKDRVATETLRGADVAETLLAYLHRDDFDLVIIGNRGLHGLREYLGSVSHKVLGGATCPVLLVK